MIPGKRRLIYAPFELSKREVHVLGLVAKYGMNGPRIAKELGVSYKTVRTHQQNILRKLDATTLAHAVFKHFVPTQAARGYKPSYCINCGREYCNSAKEKDVKQISAEHAKQARWRCVCGYCGVVHTTECEPHFVQKVNS